MSMPSYDDMRQPQRHGCLGCAAVLAFLVALVSVAMFTLAPPAIQNVVQAYGRHALETVGLHSSEEAFVSTDDVGYVGRLMPAEQQELYLKLLANILLKKESFALTGVKPDDIDPVFSALMRDHPELFWVDGSCTYTYTPIGDVMNLEPGYTLPVEQIESVQQRIDAVAAEFDAKLPQDAGEYDIARAAYEFVIDWTDYSADADQNQNIQSVFLGHASVCAGYARAYQYLLQRHGIECAYVDGSIAGADEDHAWNLARIDGQYTYVDATWGDPTYLANVDPSVLNATQGIIYDYLCLTTDEILRDRHVFADEHKWPLCTGTDLDWYRRSGCLFDVYDDAALAPAFWSAVDTGATMVAYKFTNDDAFHAARTALEEGNFLRDDLLTLAGQRGLSSFHYNYSASEELRIVKLYW